MADKRVKASLELDVSGVEQGANKAKGKMIIINKKYLINLFMLFNLLIS